MENREDEYSRLMGKALRYLSLRPRSKYEVNQYLIKYSRSGAAVENVLVRLEEMGYLDDRKFAGLWIESRDRTKPKSVFVLRHELKAKGIEESIIEDILSGRDSNEESEIIRAKKALGKKVFIWGRLPYLERKRKVFGFLARRGFSQRIAGKIFDEIWPKGYNTDTETGISE